MSRKPVILLLLAQAAYTELVGLLRVIVVVLLGFTVIVVAADTMVVNTVWRVSVWNVSHALEHPSNLTNVVVIVEPVKLVIVPVARVVVVVLLTVGLKNVASHSTGVKSTGVSCYQCVLTRYRPQFHSRESSS